MTHHVIVRHRPIPVCNGIADVGAGGVTEEYVCSDEELERAGFRLVDTSEMPEHE